MRAVRARSLILMVGLVAAAAVMLVWAGWPAHAGIGAALEQASRLNPSERSLLSGLGDVELRLCFALNAAWYTCVAWMATGGAHLVRIRRPGPPPGARRRPNPG